LFFTYTRGPVVATVIASFLILVSRTRTRLVAFAFIILAVAVVAGSWGPITSSTVYKERVTRTNTVDIRVQLDRWSLDLAKKRPLFGWGYGSFDRVLDASDLPSANLRRIDVVINTSHNTFLTILVEYGSIGLALFLVPWLAIGWRSLSDALRYPQTRWLLVGSLGALGIYTFAASAIDYRFYSFVPAVAWLLLGLLRRHQRASTASAQPTIRHVGERLTQGTRSELDSRSRG
jgi:O-antigen ligase